MAGAAKFLILIADNDDSILEFLSFCLQKEGYGAVCAGNGKNAFQIAQTMLPDLILLDLYMPICDGAQALLLLRQDPKTKNIPVIIMSGQDQPKAEVLQTLTRALGGNDYLYKTDHVRKPFKPQNLLEKIRQNLETAGRQRLLIPPASPASSGLAGMIDPSRRPSGQKTILRVGLVALDLIERIMAVKDRQPKKISRQPFNLLHLFMRKPGQIFSRQEIALHLNIEEFRVDKPIERLRELLGRPSAADHLQTVQGKGWKFAAPS